MATDLAQRWQEVQFALHGCERSVLSVREIPLHLMPSKGGVRSNESGCIITGLAQVGLEIVDEWVESSQLLGGHDAAADGASLVDFSLHGMAPGQAPVLTDCEAVITAA